MDIIYKEEFIEQTEIEALHEELATSDWKWGLKSFDNGVYRSIPHWNKHFAGYKKQGESPYECSDELKGFQKSIWNKLKETYFQNDYLVRCYANGITKGIDQRLHTDDSHEGAKTAIVYVNPNWNVDWAGETILWNRSERVITHSFLPKEGALIIFPGNIWHGVRPVSAYCDELRITLMFKTRPIK